MSPPRPLDFGHADPPRRTPLKQAVSAPQLHAQHSVDELGGVVIVSRVSPSAYGARPARSVRFLRVVAHFMLFAYQAFRISSFLRIKLFAHQAFCISQLQVVRGSHEHDAAYCENTYR